MGDLIKPTRISVISKDGECQINLTIDLNINLNTTTGGVELDKVERTEKEEEEKTIWAIPNFKTQDKVKFGKRKEQE